MADYDAGDITERERLAAQRQRAIAKSNVNSVTDEAERQMATYDMADAQNASLADVQRKQAGRKTEADRFEANRQLQNASLGLLGTFGPAANGSTITNFMNMLANRNDADNSVYWQQHADNLNTINNAEQESINQNQINRANTGATTEKAIRDIVNDLVADITNTNPNLYEDINPNDYGASDLYNKYDLTNPKLANLSGYIMPENAEQNVRNRRNTLQRNDYFSRLINGYNR